MKGCVRAPVLVVLLMALHAPVMALDLDALWDFDQPAVSEERFRAAMSAASPDERLILTTQIARTLGLRGEFAKARTMLASIEQALATASAEVSVRYHLELGRTYVSATHPEATRTPESLRLARNHFLLAVEMATRERLDALAIDALHMMAFVDTAPAEQLAWNERALAVLERSTEAAARRWEGALRNNVGYARHLAGDYDGALREFRLSRAAYERLGRDTNVRVADWMIAWTLRAQRKYAEALALQLELERAWDRVGEPDPYVYEEIEKIYRALGDDAQADRYAAKLAAARN